MSISKEDLSDWDLIDGEMEEFKETKTWVAIVGNNTPEIKIYSYITVANVAKASKAIQNLNCIKEGEQKNVVSVRKNFAEFFETMFNKAREDNQASFAKENFLVEFNKFLKD